MDDFDWLDAGEEAAWRAYLGMSRGLAEALERQLQRDSGLWLSDYEILVRLSEAPDRRLRMSDLADATTFSRSRLSHAMRRLEAPGWVERARCPNDRRGTFAQLTDVGFEKLRCAAAGHAEEVRRLLFAPLGATGTQQLRTIATEVTAALQHQPELT